MQTSLFNLVVSTIETFSLLSVQEKERLINSLVLIIRSTWHDIDQAEVERELFRVAQECKSGINQQAFEDAMLILDQYMR